jgi:fatty-acyl-CoA synthase
MAHWPAQTSVALLERSIGELLRRQARRQGEKTAVLWPSDAGLQRMSYAELLGRAERLAAWLLEHAQPGDRIAVWSRNSVPFVVIEYACALAGCVLTTFNPAWTDFEAEHALSLTNPRVVFVGPDVRGHSLRERADALAGGRLVADIASALDLEAQAARPLPVVPASAPFLIQFTSGTTGRAKAAVLSHRAALNSSYVRPLTEGATSEDVWLNGIPYHHVGGTCTIILGALSVGAAFTVVERFEPTKFVELLGQTKATRVGGVPTMWHMLMENPGFDRAGHSIRAVTMGGAYVPATLIERVRQELGAKVGVAYAMSEAPIITSTSPDDSPEIIAATVGRPAPHVELKIVDPTTRKLLPLGEIGEIAVRSPYVMEGYLNQPDATAETLDAEGFLYSGDLGRMDANGLIRLHGRARELIIRGGENIYPVEVEDALLEHRALDGVAVVGVSDEKWGQQVGAVVRLKPGFVATPSELEAFAAQRIAHFKVPRLWAFVETFPMTASGKIKKTDLPQLFEVSVG